MKKILSLLMVSFLFLSGCGIKPGELEPPANANKSEFPRTYPDPATDPKPYKP